MGYKIFQVELKQYNSSIGFSNFPGRKELKGLVTLSKSVLIEDLNIIKIFNPKMILSLIETDEIGEGYLKEIKEFSENINAYWVHLPITDYSIPDDRFEEEWVKNIRYIEENLCSSKNIFLHCKGGIGRSGLVVAKILTFFGYENTVSIEMVRAVRSGAIETAEQECYIKNL